MHTLRKSIVILLTFAFLLPLTGCSSFSKSARQQRAYEKYVSKSSMARAKQRKHFKSEQPRMPKDLEPSEPVVTTSVGPDSVTTGSSE